MKKSVLAVAMAFGVTSAFAQDLTSKKGEPILPEKGDWAISADATPFLNYLGNFFGKTANNAAPNFNFLTGNSVIVGKYFLDEKTAIRAGINLGFGSRSATNLVTQDNQPAPAAGTLPLQVSDVVKHGTTGFGITAGIEKRKGKTRLQGYYGAELGIYVGGTNDKFTYGNAYAGTGTSQGTSQAPTSTIWTPNLSTNTTYSASGSYNPANGRVTQITGGTNFQIGVRGFIGVEYFILPKMSLGGEFGYGIGVSTTGAGTVTQEGIYTGTTVGTQQTKTGTSTNFVAGTDNKNSIFGPTGSIRMNFYF